MDTYTKKQLEEILMECYNSTMFMAQLLYPEEFFGEMTSLHKDFFDFVDNCDSPRKCVQAFRGFGKTTVAKVLVRKKVLFRDKHFIGYLTNSSEVAKTISNSIKMGLVANDFVRKIFGDVRTSEFEGVDEQWAKTSWIANGETLVLPRGAGQQVNGLLWLYYRPDFWVVDDLDDRIEVRNEVQRKKLREWFYGALMYTFSQYKKDEENEMLYLDTIKHPDGLICHLMDDPDWETLSLSICDKNYKTLAPSITTQKELDEEIESHRRKHTMDVFAMERMGLAQSKEYGTFKASYFHYYDEEDEDFIKNIKPRLVNILIYDPSKTKNPASAQSGYVVWGLDFEANLFYVRQAIGEYLGVGEQYDKIIELATWYRVQALGVEITGLEDHLIYNITNEFLRKKLFWLASCLVTLDARSGRGDFTGYEGGKEGRISLLLPYYEKGLIRHNRKTCGPLEQQLLGSKLRDVADAAAYLPQMLSKGAKYMMPLDTKEDSDIESEYKQIQYDPPVRRNVFV
jgi:hypothetical protein